MIASYASDIFEMEHGKMNITSKTLIVGGFILSGFMLAGPLAAAPITVTHHGASTGATMEIFQARGRHGGGWGRHRGWNKGHLYGRMRHGHH